MDSSAAAVNKNFDTTNVIIQDTAGCGEESAPKSTLAAAVCKMDTTMITNSSANAAIIEINVNKQDVAKTNTDSKVK